LQIFLSVKEWGLKYPNSISNGYNNQHLRGVTMENLTENQEKAEKKELKTEVSPIFQVTD
jgi:hypothetical protein